MTRAAAAAVGAVLLALVGAGGASSHDSDLPRATADRADEAVGQQIHVIYAVPQDGTDRALDTNGMLTASVRNFEGWLRGQTGGLGGLRLDTFQGEPDITFVRLPRPNAEYEATGAFVRDNVDRDLKTMGFEAPAKLLAVYYDGSSTFACGGGAWPPELPGNTGMLYLSATYGAGSKCYDPARSLAGLQIMDLAILHELVHTLGFVPTCAPHHTRAGHTSDSPTDLMYAGDQGWTPTTLDVGHDDYFDASVVGCLDLAESPYLEANAPAAVPTVKLTVAVRGSGRVVSGPAGIACSTICVASFPKGTQVVLTATAKPGSRFSSWGADCIGRTHTCTLKLTRDTPAGAVATFVRILPKCKPHQRSTKKKPCRR